jgi:hypothetical protein
MNINQLQVKYNKLIEGDQPSVENIKAARKLLRSYKTKDPDEEEILSWLFEGLYLLNG